MIGGRIIAMKIFFVIIGFFVFLFSNFLHAETTLTGLSEIEVIVDIYYSNNVVV